MEFEFIRPQLLWLLLPWLLYSLLHWRSTGAKQSQQLIAPHLANVVMGEHKNNSQKHSSAWLSIAFFMLAIIAIAGPSIEKRQVPVFKTQAPESW